MSLEHPNASQNQHHTFNFQQKSSNFQQERLEVANFQQFSTTFNNFQQIHCKTLIKFQQLSTTFNTFQQKLLKLNDFQAKCSNFQQLTPYFQQQNVENHAKIDFNRFVQSSRCVRGVVEVPSTLHDWAMNFSQN